MSVTALDLHVVAETSSTITLGWTPVTGDAGYRFLTDGRIVSHTWNPAQSSVKFSKGGVASFKVEALGIVAAGTYPPASPPAPSSGFVTRNGNQLLQDGKPLVLRGINVDAFGGCWANPVNLDVLPAGCALRFWCWPARFGGDYTRLDSFIARAKARGHGLIPVLSDQWPDCGGQISDSDLDANIRIIAKRYQYEPAILFWQIGNELIRDEPWFQARASEFDPQHLVSYGAYNNEEHTAVYATDDVVDLRDYKRGTEAMPAWLHDRITQAQTKGVPVMIGEAGISTAWTPTERHDLFAAKITAAQPTVQLYLVWALDSTDGWEIHAGDPTLGLLAP